MEPDLGRARRAQTGSLQLFKRKTVCDKQRSLARQDGKQIDPIRRHPGDGTTDGTRADIQPCLSSMLADADRDVKYFANRALVTLVAS